MRAPFVLLVGLPILSAVLFIAAQVPPGREAPKELPKPAVQVTPSPGGKKEIARLNRELQGLWNLTDLEWPLINNTTTESRGYGLVNGDHISLEIHVGFSGPDQRMKGALLDTGLWKFEIEEPNRLVLEAVLGSFLDKTNHIQFREPGVKHTYQVLLVGDRLTLTHQDGQKMVFQRAPDSTPVLRDAFGRPIKEKQEGEKENSTRKDDVSKSGGSKSDGAKPEAPKPDGPKPDEPKSDGPKSSGSMPDGSTRDDGEN